MLRILVADTHWTVRRRIGNMIATHAGWEVCAEAADAAEALEMARHQAPDVAIVAVPMPGLTPTELIDGLAEGHPDLKVLALSMHEDRRTVEDCLAAGALGWVLQTDSETKIEAAIAAVGRQCAYH
jgi:DNA-binding NarL/FixJ family response regulator